MRHPSDPSISSDLTTSCSWCMKKWQFDICDVFSLCILVECLMKTSVQQPGNLATTLWKQPKPCLDAPCWPFHQVRVDNGLQLVREENTILHSQCFFNADFGWIEASVQEKCQKAHAKTKKNNWNKSFVKNCESGSNCSAWVCKPLRNCHRNGSKIALEIGAGKIAWKSLPESPERVQRFPELLEPSDSDSNPCQTQHACCVKMTTKKTCSSKKQKLNSSFVFPEHGVCCILCFLAWTFDAWWMCLSSMSRNWKARCSTQKQFASIKLDVFCASLFADFNFLCLVCSKMFKQNPKLTCWNKTCKLFVAIWTQNEKSNLFCFELLKVVGHDSVKQHEQSFFDLLKCCLKKHRLNLAAAFFDFAQEVWNLWLRVFRNESPDIFLQFEGFWMSKSQHWEANHNCPNGSAAACLLAS